MKSQDIFLLLKLASLQQQEKDLIEQHSPSRLHFSGREGWDANKEEIENEQLVREIASGSFNQQERSPVMRQAPRKPQAHGWEGWEVSEEDRNNWSFARRLAQQEQASLYTARGLASELGIGKSEANNSMKRSIDVGMIKLDRKTGRPKVNLKALREFIVYGLKYVFPVKPAEIVRGIPTSFAAPVLEGQLMTAGEMINVWPDARGKSKGQSITPLFKSVPFAVKRDPHLYEYLALADAIRLGSAREAGLAEKLLKERLQ